MTDLLKINVNDHTERKNGLTYLSWAWAWAEVLKIDPAAWWEPMNFAGAGEAFAPLCQMPDKTAMVGVRVKIADNVRQCMLPVMDHKNKAIVSPNAFDVNKAQMRCLAKAIAMHGLGLYIYAGEDLPEGDEPAKPQQSASPAALVAADVADALGPDRRDELDNMALYMIEDFKAGKTDRAIALYFELTDNEEKAYIWHQLRAEAKLRAAIKASRKEAA